MQKKIRAFEFNVFNPHFQARGPVPAFAPANHDGLRYIQVTAIDPAFKNCAVRVERRWFSGGGAAPDTGVLVRAETVLQAKFDFFSAPCAGAAEASRTVRGAAHTAPVPNALWCMSALREYLAASHYVLIEKQVDPNTGMMTLEGILLAAALGAVTGSAALGLVLIARSSVKTDWLDAPKSLTGPTRKKWAALRSVQLLRAAGDTQCADLIEATKKADDHGDTVCYVEALFRARAKGKVP